MLSLEKKHEQILEDMKNVDIKNLSGLRQERLKLNEV